jgi:hypothetical protein
VRRAGAWRLPTDKAHSISRGRSNAWITVVHKAPKIHRHARIADAAGDGNHHRQILAIRHCAGSTTASIPRARGKMKSSRTNYWRRIVETANGWTPERRVRQREMIQRWRPWKHSTGPRSTEGKAKVSRNAGKGGEREVLRMLSRALREQREALRTGARQ